MLLNYDMHIHTSYCGHAETMTIPAILNRADELNLKTIAVTDHIYAPEDLPVIDKIQNEVAQIKTNCRVIVGAEIDVDGKFSDGRFVTDKIGDIDYLIAGFHYIPGLGSYPRRREDNPLTDKEFLSRWQNALLGIVSNPKINVLAHPGRIIAVAVDVDKYFDEILDIFAETAEISARNNIFWEINELDGSKIPSQYHNNWYRIYQTALNAGVKLTYGSDAHKPEDIGKTAFTETILKRLPPNCLQLTTDI